MHEQRTLTFRRTIHFAGRETAAPHGFEERVITFLYVFFQLFYDTCQPFRSFSTISLPIDKTKPHSSARCSRTIEVVVICSTMKRTERAITRHYIIINDYHGHVASAHIATRNRFVQNTSLTVRSECI